MPLLIGSITTTYVADGEGGWGGGIVGGCVSLHSFPETSGKQAYNAHLSHFACAQT